MKRVLNWMLIAGLAVGITSCGENNGGEDDKKPLVKPVEKLALTPENKKAVIKNYAKMVYQNYKDSYDAAVKMQGVIEAFIANPSDATLQKAKRAWLDAREPYGESEVFRGSNGPIDAEGGEAWAINNEGQINAWPLNEAYIDYVKVKTDYTGVDGKYSQDVISGTMEITKENLASLNEKDEDEAAVATGWHAIEFLLWGQDDKEPKAFTNASDLSKNISAGNRPVTDYTTDKNAERRKTYLKVVTQLLVDDLNDLVQTWKVGGTYYNVFMALPENEALKNIITGPQFLAMAELSNERMLVPAYGTGGYNGCGQEDEHSCFSDNTHRDVYLNAKGIVNVLTGRYGTIEGASVIGLVKGADEKKGKELEELTNKMWVAITAIDEKAKAGTPFDKMILEEGKGMDKASQGAVVIPAAYELDELGTLIKECAAKLGITTKNRDDFEPTEIEK